MKNSERIKSNELERLTEVFEAALPVHFDDSSRIVLISDCHRGDGSWADDFSKNRNIYFAALTHYFEEKFTYIELGDGDELWKNKRLVDIIREHGDVFWLLSKFIRAGRFYSLFGNHDVIKKKNGYISEKDYHMFDPRDAEHLRLFGGIKQHEGLVLQHHETGGRIFLVHGHQADFFNDRLCKLSGFLVRYLWRPMELLGVNDPTSPAKNNRKKVAVERKLIGWVEKDRQMLIAGHTHRPVFPDTGEPPYFNDGSCVHPRCITAIEITGGNITLVKWSVKTRTDGTLFVGRDTLAGPRKLTDYFSYKYHPVRSIN